MAVLHFFRVNSILYLSILFDCSLLRADRWGGGVPIQHKSFIVGPNSMERNSFFYHSASIKAVTVHWTLVVHEVRRWLLGNRIKFLPQTTKTAHTLYLDRLSRPIVSRHAMLRFHVMFFLTDILRPLVFKVVYFKKILHFLFKGSLNIPEYVCLLFGRVLYLYTIEHAV